MRIHDLTQRPSQSKDEQHPSQDEQHPSQDEQRRWLLSGVAAPGDAVYRGSCYTSSEGWAVVLKTKDHQAMPLCLVSFTELNRWIKHDEDPFGLLSINNDVLRDIIKFSSSKV
jgi:hypothetical protein